MTSSGSTGRLIVEMDLELTVSGQSAVVRTAGPDVQVRTDHPVRFLRAVSRSLPAGGSVPFGADPVNAVVQQLSSTGGTVAVIGPRGRVVRLGADRVERLLQWRGRTAARGRRVGRWLAVAGTGVVAAAVVRAVAGRRRG